MVSSVDCGVIVQLLAADKPLEESRLHWILSGGRQTHTKFWLCSWRHRLYLCVRLHQEDELACEGKTEAADGDRYQHLGVFTCTCSSYLQRLTGPSVRGLLRCSTA